MSRVASDNRNKTLSIILGIFFALSMILGTGPGVLLVNRPETFWGIPLVYAWGIFWYLVQVIVVLIAYFTVWVPTSDEQESTTSSSTKGGTP